MENKIDILDNGYIKLVNVMGTDLDIANSARVSFDKEVSELSEKDDKLISFLIKEKHDSVLRHSVFSFEVYAPLMVARQWYKHAVGSAHLEEQMGWNESSRRYITEKETFYIPSKNEWRFSAENKKQGSNGYMPEDSGAMFTSMLDTYVGIGEDMYKKALASNIAPEQARLFLPAYGMYVRWRWTVSLNGLLHFLTLRLANDAQYEIREYTRPIEHWVSEYFPTTAKYWKEYRIEK